MKKHTFEEIKTNIESLSDCKLLSTQYDGTNEPLLLKCACGETFITTWAKFSNQDKRQCNKCGNDKAHRRHLVSQSEISKRISETGCELLSEYRGRKYPVTIRCKCGHLRTVRVNVVLDSRFSGLCTSCVEPRQHGSNRFTTEDIRELCALRGLELLSEYKNAREPIRLRCACGEEYTTTWDNVVSANKVRCDKCTGRMSGPETRIEDWLKRHGFQYERQKTFPGCGGLQRLYRFDFYLPEINTCLEYDGQHHYKAVNFSGKMSEELLVNRLLDTLDRDNVKTQFCEDNGIRLIRISYLDDLEAKLDSTLIPR